MTKLAEIAARSAKATEFHWTGPHATDFVSDVTVWTGDTTIETLAQAAEDAARTETTEQDEAEAERAAIRAEIFAALHVTPTSGGIVHYGTPARFGNTDLPMCRDSRGYHRISYYQPVDLPVTCTNCINRYGTEA